MRTRSLMLLLALTGGALTPLPARAADPSALVAAKRQLQSGVNGAKPDVILRARADFLALLANRPSPALEYWVAYASWRAEPLVIEADKTQAKKLCKEGIAACDRALAADPRMAEAIALKANLQGLSLSFNPAMGMTLGPEMDEAYGRAEGIAPENARVALFKAIGTLHKPAFVGGGAKKAMPIFDRAIALFDKAPAADSTTIDWGRDDAYLWAGRCAEQLGDLAGAKVRYEQSLAVNSELGWAKAVLLPAVVKKLAQGKGSK